MITIYNQEIKEITSTLSELDGDHTIPKNVKGKIKNVIKTLDNNVQNKNELTILINKALDELDEVGDDVNLQAYTRTQIWNIVSSLEKIFQELKDVKN